MNRLFIKISCLFLAAITFPLLAKAAALDDLVGEPASFLEEAVYKTATLEEGVIVLAETGLYRLAGLSEKPELLVQSRDSWVSEDITSIDTTFNNGNVWLVLNGNDKKAICYQLNSSSKCKSRYRSKVYKERFYPDLAIGSPISFGMPLHENDTLVVGVFDGPTYVFEKGKKEVIFPSPSYSESAEGGVSINSEYAFSATIDGLIIFDRKRGITKTIEADKIINTIAIYKDSLIMGYGSKGLYRLDLSKIEELKP